MSRFSVLLFALAAISTGTARAQECTRTPDYSVNNVGGPSSGNWSTGHAEATIIGSGTLTADFYLRAVGQSGVDHHIFYISQYADPETEGNGPAGEHAVQIRFNYTNDKIEVHNGAGTVWGCDGTCPDWTANTWYHFEVTLQLSDSCFTGKPVSWVTVKASECDTALQTIATTFAADVPLSPVLATYHSAVTYTLVDVDFDVDMVSWTRTPITTYCCSNNPDVACPAPTTNPFCDGIAVPAFMSLNEPLPPTLSWLDRLLIMLGLRDEAIPAISGGDTVTQHYSTVRLSGACTGAIVGPHEFVSAGHCVTASDESTPTPNDKVISQANRKPGTLTDKDSITYTVIQRDVHPDYMGAAVLGTGSDIYIGRTAELLPPPYAAPYEAVADAAACASTEVHGFGVTTTNTRCEAFFGWAGDAIKGGQNKMYGYCTNPNDAYADGGDSGGPAYAVGDWGGGTEARLIGPLTGGQPVFGYNYVEGPLNTAWYNGTHYAFEGSYATIDRVWLSGDVSFTTGFDISTTNPEVVCNVDAVVTGDPIASVLCTFRNDEGVTRSCSSSTPAGSVYSCTTELFRNSDTWNLFLIRITTTNGDMDTASNGALALRGAFPGEGMVWINGPAISKPLIENTIPPNAPAKGGTFMCTVDANTAQVTKSVGCQYESVGYGSDIACNNNVIDIVSGLKLYTCEGRVPLGAPDDGVWTLKSAWVIDEFDQKVFVDSGSGFTMRGCDDGPSYPTATNAYSANQVFAVTGGSYPFFEFYARASVSDQSGGVGIGTGPVTSEADMLLGVRFNSTGTIDVRTDGTWTDTGYGYLAGQWYTFRLRASDLSLYGQPHATPSTFDAWVDGCGVASSSDGSSQIANDAAMSAVRVYEPLGNWAAFSDDATQTIGVREMRASEPFCFPDQCVFEGSFGCDATPDGCGGTINCGPCVGTCEADWTCTP